MKPNGEGIKMNKFVIFDGEETEKQFLEKCLNQWDLTANADISEVGKLIQIATVFTEIKHRLDEIE